MILPMLVLLGTRLKKVPVLGKLIDERFMDHRLRAQRAAGLTGFLLADLLFGYRRFVNHIFSWDLLAIAVAVPVIYIALVAWYLITE